MAKDGTYARPKKANGLKLGCLFGLLLSALHVAAARLPTEYLELEYVESTGVQSVDSDYVPSGNVVVDADFAFTDPMTVQQRVFGTSTGDGNFLTLTVYINSWNCYAWAYKDGWGNWTSTEVPVTIDRKRLVLDGVDNTVTLVDVASGTTNHAAKIATTHVKTARAPLRLFANISDGTAIKENGRLRLYACAIHDATRTAVRNFVPCRRLSDGEVGLYDTVTEAFFSDQNGIGLVAGPAADVAPFHVSAPDDQTWDAAMAECCPSVVVTDKATGATLAEGTDYELAYANNTGVGEAWVVVTGLGDYAGERMERTFNIFPSTSRLPEGYREVKYIRAYGSQYIQTAVFATPQTMAAIDATVAPVSPSTYLFNATPATDEATGLLFHAYVNALSMFAATCGDATTVEDGIAVGKPWNKDGFCTASVITPKPFERYVVAIDSARSAYWIDGRKTIDLTMAREQNSANPFRVFEKTSGFIHSFRVAENGETTHAFIPCVRTSDGVAGLHDVKSDTFCANASSSDQPFTAGPFAYTYELAVAPIDVQAWDGAQAVVPTLTVTDRATGVALVADEDYTVAFSGNDAAGTATAIVTGQGAYAGSAATNTFTIYRTGGAFTYASWNVHDFTQGPATNGLIEAWGNLKDALDAYHAFLGDLSADWLGVNDSVSQFVYQWGQMGSRRGVFLDYPQTTLGDASGAIPRSTFCNNRFEVLSSQEVEGCALEQRVKVDGSYEAVFVNVRLSDSTAERTAQIAALANRYKDEPRVIVSGEFRTERTLSDGRRHTDWSALDPLAAAGFHLANTAALLGPVHDRATPNAATTHIASKGFAVTSVSVKPPFVSDADEHGLSDDAVLVCSFAPLAFGRVMRPSNPVPQLYTGAALTPVVTANDAYVVTPPENAVTVGVYAVTVALKDKTATTWDDGTTADVTRTFTVEKAANGWVEKPSVSVSRWERRDGTPGTIAPGRAVFGGTPTCNYTDAQLAALTKGTYAVVFTVPGTDNYDALEYVVNVTVTETFRTSVSADGATADVQFSYSDKPRKLYLVYGFGDGAGETSKWDHVVCVGDVAPGVTAWSGIELPETIGYEHPNYRFLVSGDFGSASYEMDGLMAQWDAVENAGRGVHAAAPATWTELVKDVSATWEGTPVFGTDAVTLDGASFQTTLAGAADAINARALTVQVMMRPDASKWQIYQGVFQFGPGSDNRSLILDTRHQTEVGQGIYSFGGLQYREGGWHGRSAVLASNWYAGTNVMVTVTVDATGAHLWFDDATQPVFTTVGGGKEATSDLFTFGRYIGNKAYPMDVHAIRVYNRTLSADEIAANYKVDADRFGVRFAETSALLTAAKPVWAEVRGGTRANVRFTAAERARKLWFVWGARDAGPQTNGWAGAACVADVPAGVASFANLELPAASRGAGCGRFLLANAEQLSTDYVMDGLLAQWDGIDNAARNVHESSPTSWVDLVSGRAMTVFGSPTYGEKSIHNGSDSYFQTEIAGAADAINANAFTVQVMLRPDPDVWQDYQGVFQFGPGSGNRSLILDTRPDAPGGAKFSFCGLQYREGGWNFRSAVTAPNWYFGTNVLVTVTTDATGAHLWFDDAVQPVFTTVGGGKEATSDLFTFGRYLGNQSYPMTAYAIRVYNRTLSVAEIAANCILDRTRFLDGEPPWDASAPLEIAAPTLIILR